VRDRKLKLFDLLECIIDDYCKIGRRNFSSLSKATATPSVLLMLSIIFIVSYYMTTGTIMAEISTGSTTTAATTTIVNASSKIYNNTIPSAESVYSSQSMPLPTSVSSFVIYIVDEAHENTATAPWKHVSDHNSIYIPTNLVIPQGVTISFLDADAPWDTPHPHTINVIDSSSGKLAYTTGKLDYTNSSRPVVLQSGKYDVVDTKYTWMKGTITVSAGQPKGRSAGNISNGNLVVGGFYTPTNQVANNKDNDGGVHPGWLGYYKAELPKNGFTILSQYNFHYATCKYCPGGFWPDQKTADHTLIIFSTQQPLSEALNKLAKMVWNNVYI
jgi:hypothetical protein